MHAVQMSETNIRLEVLGPMEGRANSKPPAIRVRNDGRTLGLVVDRRRFISDTAAQRPEAVHAEVIADGHEIGVFPIIVDIFKLIEYSFIPTSKRGIGGSHSIHSCSKFITSCCQTTKT